MSPLHLAVEMCSAITYPQFNAYLTLMIVGCIQELAVNPLACLHLSVLKLYTITADTQKCLGRDRSVHKSCSDLSGKPEHVRILDRTQIGSLERSLHIPEYESGSGQEISTGALPWNSGQDVSPHISKDSSASKESSKIFSDYCTHPLQAGTPDFLFVLYLFAAVRPERLGHPESLFVLYLFATVRPERNSSASKESPQIFLDYSTGLLQAGTSRVFVLYLLATVRPKRNSSASKVSSQIFSA
ncbi:hypothetical protein B0H11DRAFT_1939662 [Mycena galericulata]|nr:hypothetical protein B0H11DRAFT_1939662 [Mycena galericulata]